MKEAFESEFLDWLEVEEVTEQLAEDERYRREWERWRSLTVAERQSRLLQVRGVLQSPELITAFERVDRTDFLPQRWMHFALLNEPITVEPGFTNSQPSTVAQMLEWLKPQPGQRILDVGAGTAWTTALIAEVVGPTGEVVGTEVRANAVQLGQRNLKRYRYRNISLHHTPETLGWPPDGPYDAILVSAKASEVPETLLDQLKTGGRMVVPVGEQILVAEKKRNYRRQRVANKRLVVRSYPDYYFVPLRSAEHHQLDEDEALVASAGWFEVPRRK